MNFAKFKPTEADVEAQKQFRDAIYNFKNFRFTLFLMALITIISVIEFVKIGLMPNIVDLFDFGAGFGADTAHGQLWRLITPIFLHATVEHLLFNMFALLMIGYYVNYFYTTRFYGFIFLFSGVGGAIVSAIASPKTVSVGASGAIFGLYGAMIAAMFIGSEQREKFKYFSKTTIYIIAYQGVEALYKSSHAAHVDNWAHIGGLLFGFAAGYAYIYSLKHEIQLKRVYVSSTLAILAFAAFIMPHVVAISAIQPSDIYEFQLVYGWAKKLAPLETEMDQKQKDLDNHKISDVEFHTWVAKDLEPRYASVVNFVKYDSKYVNGRIMEDSKNAFIELADTCGAVLKFSNNFLYSRQPAEAKLSSEQKQLALKCEQKGQILNKVFTEAVANF